MRKLWRIGLWLAVALGAAACRPAPRPDRATQQLLLELDGYISASNMYVARKLDQMDALGKLARSTRDPLRRYELEMNVAREFFPFSFDSTQVYLKHCQELAQDVLGDQDLYNEASVQLGHLYAKAGSYLEASQLLYGGVDTTTFSPSLMAEYIWDLYDFSKDLAGNSGMVEKLSIPLDSSFRPRLYQLLPKDSDRWRSVLRDDFMDRGNLASADSVNRLLLATVKPEDRNFAIFAFFQSEIENLRGNQPERMAWLIRSAECDIVNAVKDYASLTMVAQNILPLDVDRSFRYLRMAQEDAVLYNAKLRPWQISRFLIEVESAYSVRQDRQNKMGIISSILLAVLVLVLSLITYFLVVRSRKLSRMQKALADSNVQLAAANEELSVLNRQISKADKVKDAYIMDFLQGLSEQVALIRSQDNRFRNLLKQGKSDQLFRELAISERSEKALEDFYRKFDETFLALYPDFVDQFNALLQEDARIVPPPGRLTTELRIFALIRLGVDDSKKIATMLDYSVSTIYNYKVSVKNAALGDRDKFEERVKMIGK
jgi:cell division protein FtsB